MNKTQKIIELLALASEVFGKDVSKEAQRFWVTSLLEYELSDIENAFAHFLRTEKFMPRPSEIISRLIPDAEVKALKAYQEVEYQIIVTGSYQSIEFTDKTIHAVLMSFGGWIAYCLMLRDYSEKDMSFHEKEFLRRYKLYAGRNLHDVPKMLPGSIEAENRAHGYLPESTLLGTAIQKVISKIPKEES